MGILYLKTIVEITISDETTIDFHEHEQLQQVQPKLMLLDIDLEIIIQAQFI
jgi:hypothetical protein